LRSSVDIFIYIPAESDIGFLRKFSMIMLIIYENPNIQLKIKYILIKLEIVRVGS